MKALREAATSRRSRQRGGLTVLTGGSLPAFGTDAPISTDFVYTCSSVQTGGDLTVVYVYDSEEDKRIERQFCLQFRQYLREKEMTATFRSQTMKLEGSKMG